MALKSDRLSGVLTALVTPFRDGGLDEPAFATLVERQISAGAHGLVVASGVAGEAVTLRGDDARRLIALCVKLADGQVPVIAGGSSNSTAAAVTLVRQAKDLGADAALVTTPWYNRPSQEGVVRHYQAIADSVSFPILVDSSPSRTMTDLPIATLHRLAALPTLVGIVDASADMTRVTATRRACPGWVSLSGDDPSWLGHMALGGHGCLSLTANLAPQAMAALYAAASAQDWTTARRRHDQLFDLQLALAMDPSPSAAKFGLSSLGLCRPDVRLPISPYPEASGPALIAAMRACGLTVSA